MSQGVSRSPGPVQLTSCQVDLARGLVLGIDQTQRLTTKEVDVLAYLVERAGDPVSRDELLRSVWGFKGRLPASRAPDFTIRRLRAKIEHDPARPDHVLTVHGVGYRFVQGRVPAPMLDPGSGLQPPGAPYDPRWFVPRSSLEQSASALLGQPGAPVVLIGPPGVGKTWLLRRLLERSRAPGDRSLELEVNQIDPANGDDRIERSMLQLALELAVVAGIDEEVLAGAWSRMGHPRRRLTRFVETHVLPAIEGLLFLAIDGADRWHRLGDPAGFFGLLRGWSSQNRPPWDRLRLLLTISTEPALLVEAHQSPFNLAPPVHVGDLRAEDLGYLARLHGIELSSRDTARLRSAVGGHPLLLRLLLFEAAVGERPLVELIDEATGEHGVLATYLRGQLAHLLSQPDLVEAMRQLIEDPDVVLSYAVRHRLHSAGLVRIQQGQTTLRYGIQERFFRSNLG